MRFFINIAIICLIIISIVFFRFNKNSKVDIIQSTNHIKYSEVPISQIKSDPPILEDVCVDLDINKAVVKSYNLAEYTEKNAQQILLNYINTYYEDDIVRMKDVYKSATGFHQDQIKAFEYDLNNDGNKEVLGIVVDQYIFGGALGTTFFVLQKSDDKYQIISELFYSYSNPVVTIMANQTHSYHDLQFREYFDKFDGYNIIQFDKNRGYNFVYLCQ